MDSDDLIYYINSVDETRTILADILTILRTQEQNIHDIINHPSYEVQTPPPQRYHPRFSRERSYAQSPLTRPTFNTSSSPTSSPTPASRSTLPRATPLPRYPYGINLQPSPPQPIQRPRRIIPQVFTNIPSDTTNVPPSNSFSSPTDNIPPSNSFSSPTTNLPLNPTTNNPVSERIRDLLGAALLGEINNSLSPVVIAPSTRQISESTENIRFNDIAIPSYTRCPISHEEFAPNTFITRITHCGHYFDPESLNTWFSRNVRCPICRYDIRTHLTSNNTHTIDEEEEEEEEEEIIQQDISSGNNLEDFINHVRNDQRDNPLPQNTRRVYRYQFDVTPFVTRALHNLNDTDISGN